MKRPPDFAQRQAALDPERSFIVQAPAGSGKTTLLVQRYLTLLAHAERPEAVVAMTFTRKAAAEMRDRVLQVLENNGAPEVARRDAAMRWNLRTDTSRLQIQTIDSLCATLTRQMPVVSHLGGNARVVEHAEEYYRTAARRTLRSLAEGDPEAQALFRKVSLHFDNALSKLEDQIAEMLSKREQWRAFAGIGHPEDVQVFCDLLQYAQQSLTEVFREAGAVDFTAITRAAIDALGGPESPSDLLYALDYRVQHLLVDEFQDTSQAQYDLVQTLTGQWSDGDGRTLFLVGDPMQSIYRFREANVSLFLRCWNKEQLGAVRLMPLRLSANFRSTPEIVQWTAETFAPLMPTDDETHGAVKFSAAEATRAQTKVIPTLDPFVDDKDGTEEAEKVVQLIRGAPNKGEVAILVRSRTHLSNILPKLRSEGIPYEAIEIDALQHEQHILDLLSLTRALVHLADRTAWLSCLRAPWCGLTLADLSALAERDERTVLQLLQDRDKVWALSPDGRVRAIRTGEILAEASDTMGRMPLRDLVERTWIALGGPSVLTHPSQREDVQTFLDLIEQFEIGGTIRDFSLLKDRLEFLFARPEPRADAVKVMTIHTAKGLEFDTVILPHMGGNTRALEQALLIWADGMVAALPQRGDQDPDYQRVRDEIKVHEAHELARLFYVAATRAKNRLHLLGSTTRSQNGLKKASSSTFLGLIWSTVEPQFQAVARMRVPQQQSLILERAPSGLRRLPADWAMPQLASAVSWQPEWQPAAASARAISYEWVSDTARHVGTIVHEVLKRVAREGMALWTDDRLRMLHPLFQSELQRLGVPDPEIPEAAQKVQAALGTTVNSVRGRWLLAPHAESQSEWAIAGRLGDKLITGSVDRAFRDDKGTLWIVDFKTSEHQGANLTRFLDEEQRRYREQLENYAGLMAQSVPGPIALGLYFPLNDAWREWAFEEVAVPAS